MNLRFAGFFLTFSLFYFPFFNTASPVEAAKDAIQIKGSDTMVNLVGGWAEEFMAENKQAMVAVTGGGSGTGIAAFLNGVVDIASVSRSIKEKEASLAKRKGISPNEVVVARDGILVVVHPKNKLSELSLSQLADIFTGKITNWKQVGGSDLGIILLSREVSSGTHVDFKEAIILPKYPGGEFAQNALLLPSSQAIHDEVAQNERAIGYFGLGYLSPKVKAIALASSPGAAPLKPTLDNIMKGTYPLSRSLYFYTNGKPSGLVKSFIDFVLSSKGQAIVSKTGFIPLSR